MKPLRPTLDTLALRCSPAVARLNPHLFPDAPAPDAPPFRLRAALAQPDQPATLADLPRREGRRSSRGPRRLGAPAPAVLVRYTFRICGRLRDWDNAVGSTKPVTDALVTCGVIPDDSPEHIALEVRQERVATRAEAGTLVEVFDIAEGHGGDALK